MLSRLKGASEAPATTPAPLSAEKERTGAEEG